MFSVEADKALAYFRDLGIFVFAPRRFFQSIQREPVDESIRRLATYIATFSAIELAFFGTIMGRDPGLSLGRILGVSIIETALSLLYLPSFIAVTLFLKSKRPLRIAITYALTFRFLFFSVPLVMYGLFLLTEDYSFALLRGIAGYLFSVSYVFFLPLALARTARMRAIATLLSAVVGLGTLIGISAFMMRSTGEAQPGWRSLSLFYDPIGEEADEVDVSFSLGDENGSLRRSLNVIRALYVEQKISSDSIRRVLRLPNEFGKTEWQALSKPLARASVHRKEKLERTLSQTQFRTTHMLIGKELAELDASERSRESIDDFYDHASFDALGRALDAYIDLQQADINGLRMKTEHLNQRIWLLKLGLLI